MGDFDYGFERGWWGEDGVPNWIDDSEPRREEVKPVEIEQKEKDVTDVAVKNPKITIFGVGSAGCNLLDILADSDIGGKVKLVAVDEFNTTFILFN